MTFNAHAGRSKRGLWAAGVSLLAIYGCASSGGSTGADGGSQDAGAGSGGSSSSGSGGQSVPGSGGTTGSNGSGGSKASGSGGSTGSGGRSSGSGGTSAGSGGVGAAGSSGAGGVSPPHCTTFIDPIYPSAQTVEAGADTTVRLKVTALESPNEMLTWTWSVLDPSLMHVTVTTSSDNDEDRGTVAEFRVISPGSYQVKATPTGDARCTEANLTIYGSVPQGPSVNFRVSGSGYPTQDKTVQLSNLPDSLELEPGGTYSVTPIDPLSGKLLDTYVRISSSNQVFTFEGNTTTKPVTTTLLPSQNYSFLIAPMEAGIDGGSGGASSALFAPFLQSSMPGTWSMSLLVDQGTPVSGQMLAPDGTPIQNARMQLRSTMGTPSTVGVSDATGGLIMWARDGSMSAIVVPPDGSGLPVATTAGDAIGSASGAPVSLTMQWAPMAQSTLTVQVQGADGASPVGNAQVRLRSSGVPYSAGTLTVQTPGASDVQLPTTATVTDSLSTAADGHVTFPPFPAGIYTLTIIPPAAAAPAAVTTIPLTLTAGNVTQTIALARKTALSTTVMTPDKVPAVGAQVFAIDVGNACTASTTGCPGTNPQAAGTSAATGSVYSGQTDASGMLSLSVDPDRTYEIIVQPSAADASTMGRAVRSAFHLCTTATAPCSATNDTLAPVTLPMGMTYQGVLRDINGPTVGGASVQVFCALASATCDPNVSLAEATSLGNGSFTVTVPVPQ